MKILHLISGGDVGGAKTHVLSLLVELNKTITADLICFREGDFSEDAKALGIPTKTIIGKNFIKAFRKLKQYVAENNYDIIHCHGSRGNFMGMLLKTFFKMPVVTTVHSDNRLDYLGRPFGRLVYGNMNKFALKRLDFHIGVSDSMSELLIQRGHLPDKIFTIYNGLDFSTVPAPSKIRKEFLTSVGCPEFEDCVIVGIAARLSPVKSVATLINAFATASENSPKLRLLIAGEGQEYSTLRKLCSKHGIEDKVCFAGWVSDMDSFYNSIDINTLTSLSETFPYAITEGARFHLPTISSNVGGVPLLILNGITGFLFSPTDETALASHLQTLYSDKELREKMGHALFERAKTNFSLERTRETQLEIYNNISRKSSRKISGKRDGVLICGAYGRGNSGDDAILEAIVKEMRDIDIDMPLYVMSRSPKKTAVSYRVRTLYTFNIFKFLKKLRKTKLYINGGGSLIQDVTSSRSLWFYLFTIYAAAKLGNKVIMYGCGIGPLSKKNNRKLTRKILNKNVDIITLREDDSLNELIQMNISAPKTVISADPALILPPADKDIIDSVFISNGIPLDGNYISVTLRQWQNFNIKAKEFAAAVEYAYKRYGLTPVFVSVEPKHDIHAAKLTASYLTVPYYIIERKYDSGIVIGILARMKLVISMRLHGLVFAANQGVPIIGAVYDKKCSAFLKYIGQKLYDDLDNITAEMLCDFIDEAIKQSADTSQIKNAVMRLRNIESRNASSALELLNSGR